MRRIALTAVSLLAAGVFAAPAAHAADLPTVSTFAFSTTGVVDTTNGDVPLTLAVGVTDAPGGAGFTAVRIDGRFPGTPASTREYFNGEVAVPTPQTRIDGRIPITVPAGYMRTWSFRLFVSRADGSSVELTAQLDTAGLRRTLASKVTAAPAAPVNLRVTKEIFWTTLPPAVSYNAYARWTRPAGPVPYASRTTGTAGCGKNVWGNAIDQSVSGNADFIARCTATVRLVNDFGESPPVSASN